MRGWRKAGGFTLIELLVVIAIIALLIGILLPALGEAKRSGKLTQCLGRMQQIGVAANSYAVTFQDRVVSYTWTKNVFRPSAWSDAQPAGGVYADDIAAGRAQALDFIHRATQIPVSELTAPSNWIPHIIYNHLALAEQQDWKLPSVEFTCPNDANRIRWQKSFDVFKTGGAQPQPNGSATDPNFRRWYVSASYAFVPAALGIDRDQGNFRAILNEGADHRTYRPFLGGEANNNILGRRKITDVFNPGSKVYVHDQEARHFGKRNWHATSPEAQQPLLFFDGHTKVYKNGVPANTGVTLAYGAQRKGNQVNPGWTPTIPGVNAFAAFTYPYGNPEAWEAPLRNGGYAGTDTMTGYYRYTRGGLKGVDVEQPEVHAP